MAIAMVAMLAFGGTYAFFTAQTDGAITSDTVTTGTVKIANGTKATISKLIQTEKAVPGDKLWEVDVNVDLSQSNVALYVFATWTLTNTDNLILTIENLGDGWTIVPNTTDAYYKEVAVDDLDTPLSFTADVTLATTNGNDKMNKQVSCSVKFLASQQANIEVEDAYKEAVTPTATPSQGS